MSSPRKTLGAPAFAGATYRYDPATAVAHATDAPRFALAIATLIRSSAGTPFLTAVISAAIDTAISGGVRLPM